MLHYGIQYAALDPAAQRELAILLTGGVTRSPVRPGTGRSRRAADANNVVDGNRG